MGNDGVNGVQVINYYGGTIFVQAPSSTPFFSMPEAVMQIAHPVELLPPDQLALKLMCYLTNGPDELKRWKSLCYKSKQS
jgi:chemotaxis response regulator CheB